MAAERIGRRVCALVLWLLMLAALSCGPDTSELGVRDTAAGT